MAVFQITTANSILTTGDQEDAFNLDTPYEDTLIVDVNALLRADGYHATGAVLAKTRAWTVQVNGLIRSEDLGVLHERYNIASSTITLGATGEIYGYNTGVYNQSPVTIVNAGKITGQKTGIISFDAGSFTLKNTGTVAGGHSILTDASADTITNSGTLDGDVDLDDSNDRLTNSGAIVGRVDMGDGNDTITNSKSIFGDVSLGSGPNALTNTNAGVIAGTVTGGDSQDIVKNAGKIEGIVDLRGGNDSFTGGNFTDILVDGAGFDTLKLGGGDDFYYGVGAFNQTQDGFDAIDGGDGFDSYYATSAIDSVYVNMDKKAHDFSPFIPGAGLVAGNTATGIGLSTDTIRNFEAVLGGAGGDIVYGSATGNLVSGFGGADSLFGLGGNDVLIGGDGADAICGGVGRDYLTGGADGDSFLYAALSDSGTTGINRDAILDFQTGHDRIHLGFIDANSKNGAAINDTFTFIGAQIFGGVAGQLRVTALSSGQIVEGDVNGDGKADFTIELAGLTVAPTASDFIL